MTKIHCSALAALLLSPLAAATDVTVVGVFPSKAVVQINGGPARTLAIGQKTAEGVVLVSVDRGGATLDIDGKRRSLKLGQQHAAVTGAAGGSVVVAAGPGGHFILDGQINGGPVRFVLDTGATVVSISAEDATRLGVDTRNAPVAQMHTANGVAAARRVRLASVSVGSISVQNVEAVVMDTPGMPALLGMSFLNRMNMRREGEILTLTRRY
jgi:aspartyl protease family protein